MEKIIISVVFMLGMIIYENIAKKSKEKTEASGPRRNKPGVASRPMPPSPPRHVSPVASRPASPSPASEAALHRESLVTRAARRRPIPQEGECALNDRHPHPIAVDDLEPESSSVPTGPEMTDAERAAHFARWRQAIIDTQILERKF